MKIVKKFILYLIYVILGIIVAFNVYSFICINILKADLAAVNGYTVLEVVSGSMEPTIKVGDLVIINANVKTFVKGDVITFYDENNSFVTHRIYKIDDNDIYTKGDNNDSVDRYPIKADKIVGKYVFKIPHAGKIMTSIRNPFVLIMILIIGILVCYLVSTDKDGKPIITEEDKEYQEYLDYKLGRHRKK